MVLNNFNVVLMAIKFSISNNQFVEIFPLVLTNIMLRLLGINVSLLFCIICR